jgi:hypothetical protein
VDPNNVILQPVNEQPDFVGGHTHTYASQLLHLANLDMREQAKRNQLIAPVQEGLPQDVRPPTIPPMPIAPQPYAENIKQAPQAVGSVGQDEPTFAQFNQQPHWAQNFAPQAVGSVGQDEPTFQEGFEQAKRSQANFDRLVGLSHGKSLPEYYDDTQTYNDAVRGWKEYPKGNKYDLKYREKLMEKEQQRIGSDLDKSQLRKRYQTGT